MDKRRKQSAGAAILEWVGGVAPMIAHITGEGEPFRPVGILWLDEDARVIGFRVARPDEWRGEVAESLRQAIERPVVGKPHAPDRIRVFSPDLADAVRASFPKLAVVLAPTPEFEEALADMNAHMNAERPPVPSFFSHEVGPEQVASLFRAAAGFYRATPWKTVPTDRHLFRVTVEALGVREALVSIIGQRGENFGFTLFADRADFELFLKADRVFALGGKPKLPPHFSLNFERGADLAPELRKEIARNAFEVAGASGYPLLLVTDEDLVQIPPTLKNVAKAEAIARALTRALTERKALRVAWDGGEPFVRTIPVETVTGAVEVIVGATF